MTELSKDEFTRLVAEAIGITDEFVKSYPEQGKWDYTLALWAYSKGFQAGLHHGCDKDDAPENLE